MSIERDACWTAAVVSCAVVLFMSFGWYGFLLDNVRTTTLRAYDEDEMSGILQRLG